MDKIGDDKAISTSPRVPREMVVGAMAGAWLSNARNNGHHGDLDIDGAREAVERVLTDGPHGHYPFDVVLAAIATALGWTPGQGQGGSK